MKEIIILMAIVFVVAFLVQNSGYDDTDIKADKKRSGLILYTDYKTGLQYIKGGIFGSIIPRLNTDGTHMREGDVAL